MKVISWPCKSSDASECPKVRGKGMHLESSAVIWEPFCWVHFKCRRSGVPLDPVNEKHSYYAAAVRIFSEIAA